MDRGGGILGNWSTVKSDVPERGQATEAGHDTLVQRRQSWQNVSVPPWDPGQGTGARGVPLGRVLVMEGPGRGSVLFSGAKT